MSLLWIIGRKNDEQNCSLESDHRERVITWRCVFFLSLSYFVLRRDTIRNIFCADRDLVFSASTFTERTRILFRVMLCSRKRNERWAKDHHHSTFFSQTMELYLSPYLSELYLISINLSHNERIHQWCIFMSKDSSNVCVCSIMKWFSHLRGHIEYSCICWPCHWWYRIIVLHRSVVLLYSPSIVCADLIAHFISACSRSNKRTQARTSDKRQILMCAHVESCQKNIDWSDR